MLGIDNLVDLASDAIIVGKNVERQLSDGFQILTDVPVIVFQDFGRIQSIATKAKAALKELADLTPDEIEEFEARVAEQADIPNDGIFGKVRGSLRLIARGYRVALEIEDIYTDARDLFAKAPAVAA